LSQNISKHQGDSGQQAEARNVILDAAEQLFAQNGIEGTAIRQIINEAEVNLGAVNYHFGTKDRLAMEIFARRLEPVNREGVARLDALEANAGGKKLTVEQIVAALIRPAVELQAGAPSGEENFMRLMSRSFHEPNPELKKFIHQQFGEVARRFDSVLLRSLPGLKLDNLIWRFTFVFGALHHGQEHWLCFDEFPAPSSGRKLRKPDREEFIERLAFAAAGLSAPIKKAR
jgi:AcrR family transcriptional regulator